jgi:hypothetical protein
MNQELWPALPLKAWKDTYDTLHMWTQIVGKIRLKLSPFENHWWETALYVTARGLTTSPIPYGQRTFEIRFDFIDHALEIETSDGERRSMALAPRTVADFYQELMSVLISLGIHVKIDTMPKEVADPIPCDQDRKHASYDAEYAHRFWRALVQADRVMKVFKGRFIGKCSPVHFFWGSFDLAVSRFSGKRAAERVGADHITQVGYSHEVISCGFWPGSGNIEGAAFYAYSAPEPQGFEKGPVLPKAAFYNPPSKGYVLMYDEVRAAANPDQMLLDFFQSTYELGARLAHWDRAELELGSSWHEEAKSA